MAPREDQDDCKVDAKNVGQLLEIAVSNHRDVLVELQDMKEAIRLGEPYPEAEAKRIVTMVSKTIQSVFEERKRLDELGKKTGGAYATQELDFDALRAEIRRRLDELRAARRPREVPDQPE